MPPSFCNSVRGAAEFVAVRVGMDVDAEVEVEVAVEMEVEVEVEVTARAASSASSSMPVARSGREVVMARDSDAACRGEEAGKKWRRHYKVGVIRCIRRKPFTIPRKAAVLQLWSLAGTINIVLVWCLLHGQRTQRPARRR